MAKFSNDVDLLKWEQVLFRELASASQTLVQGNDGALAGTTFTSAGASLVSAGVQAGHVIYLQGGVTLDGCFEVVSVDAETQLTVSVVRQQQEDAAITPPGGSAISYRISTFDPQAEEVGYSLLQYFGIKATGETEEVTADDILNSRELRQASVYAVLSAVFAGSACGKNDAAGYGEKSRWYRQQFYQARAKVRLEIDTNNDQAADRIQTGGTMRLRRL
jgi:hypothetical protein